MYVETLRKGVKNIHVFQGGRVTDQFHNFKDILSSNFLQYWGAGASRN